MRDELREEGAAEKGSAHRIHGMRTNQRDQIIDERRDSTRLRKQRVEVEPEGAMMPGLELEMSAPSGDKLEKRGSGQRLIAAQGTARPFVP